jgi:hypothetical protein
MYDDRTEMLSDFAKCNDDHDAEIARRTSRMCLLWIGVAWGLCIFGCSRSGATSSPTHVPLPAQTAIFGGSSPSHCRVRCISRGIACVREELGLDPGEQEELGDGQLEAVFRSLETAGKKLGSNIIRVRVDDTIRNLGEGPAVPVLLVHKTGHLYLLVGAIRVNDRLLCQVVHGNEGVSLFTKQVLLDGGFQEAWRLQKKEGVGVPIHVGAAVLELDKLRHNFGEFLPDKQLECTFQLRNVGDEVVILDKAFASCSCTAQNLTARMELAPGAIFDLKVGTHTRAASAMQNVVWFTVFEKGSGKSRRVEVWQLGSQRESMAVMPESLDFGGVAPGNRCTRSIRFSEVASDRFILTGIDVGKLPITHNISVAKDKQGFSTYRVDMELCPREQDVGEQTGIITFMTDSVVRPKVLAPVRYKVAPPVLAVPSVVSVGAVHAGDVGEQRIQIISRIGDLSDLSVESCPDECSVRVNKDENPPELVVGVRLHKAGIWQGTIKVAISLPNRKEVIDIKCAGYVQE